MHVFNGKKKNKSLLNPFLRSVFNSYSVLLLFKGEGRWNLAD